MTFLVKQGDSAESAPTQRGPDHYRAADHFYGAQLPERLRALARRGASERHSFINGVFIHEWKVLKHESERIKKGHHVFVRRAASLWAEYERRAATLGEGPWDVKDRIIIDCRNFALLDASLLRSVGMPARIRNGFASYLGTGHLQDHWICERWEGYRWVADDSDIQKSGLGEDDFYNAASAWLRAGTDAGFASRCGYGPHESDRGMWTVRLNAVRDLAALDGFVAVSGDGWGLGTKKVDDLSDGDVLLLDDLCRHAAAGSYVRLPPGVSMPPRISHYDYLAGQSRELGWMDES